MTLIEIVISTVSIFRGEVPSIDGNLYSVIQWSKSCKMSVLWIFQVSAKGVLRVVPRVCQGCFKGVLRVFQGCFKGISRDC